MKIFTTSQVADLDRYTIANEPIEPIDLMERASLRLAGWLAERFNARHRIAVFAGYGNNGGDALAVSRILAMKNFKVSVFIPDAGRCFSDCFLINLNRLGHTVNVGTIDWNDNGQLPELNNYDLIVDGLFGSGLTRPISGFPARLISHLNHSGVPIISIDIPSGLMGEENHNNDQESIIRASQTLTLQFPKLSFFFPENEQFTGKWEILPIGLHNNWIEMTETPWQYSDLKTIVSIVKPRGKFSHKGNFGHALLVAGSYGKMGAAILAAKGCLRSGAGLLTVHVPKSGNLIMQTALPEAMVSSDESDKLISCLPHLSGYKAVGIGPGIGNDDATVLTLRFLFENCHSPVVVDADALNILSGHPEIVSLLPEESILTPHPVEFERLTRPAKSGFERLQIAISYARMHRITIIIKGAYTVIVFSDGSCWFNSTGNPGMATGGSGDVLTGIITGLLAQGYSPREAALLGVYIHGLSGDLSLKDSSEEALLAGDIADNLGRAYAMLKSDPDFGKAKKRTNFES
jgi:hydroxyethylthiazole kinase-like uncharacterized protein yjeF